MNSRCWTEYLQRCVASQSFQIRLESNSVYMYNLYQQIEFYNNNIIDDFNGEDEVIKMYIADVLERKEYKTSFGLMKGNPKKKYMGRIVQKSIESFSVEAEGVIEFYNYRNARCKIDDDTVVKIISLNNRKFAFDGDTVPIRYNPETLRGHVLINDKTYINTNKRHFGREFLCTVDVTNPKKFLPTDLRHPKFSNLSPVTDTYGNGVICFDPVSIKKGCPKVSQFIPFEVAKNMLFVISYLAWKPRFNYPLGIVIKAFPPCTSLTAETLLRVHYTVPCPANEYWDPQPFDYSNCKVFNNVFTIDPKSAVYLDDALSCEQCPDQPGRYTIGIHITDVSCLVPIDTQLDKNAKEILCSYYLESSGRLTQRMLPDSTSKAASLLPNKQVKGFSLVTAVDVIDNEVVDIVTAPVIRHSLIISKRKMSYKEAESILIGRNDSDNERDALVILWKFAKYLRKLRLGSFYFSHDLSSVLSETLVEELMIFMNTQVAQFLVDKNVPVILRAQEPPDQIKLKAFVDKHKSDLLCFPNTQKLVYQFYTPKCEAEFSFELSFNILDIVLSSEDLVTVLNYFVNQFNHPKYLALHNELISLKQKSYYYLHQSNASECRHHDDLCLEMYTQFTSPIRRYVDIIIQRLLTAVLDNESSPYTQKKLDELVNHLNEQSCTQKWRKFKTHVDEIHLAYQVKEGSQEYLGTIVYSSDRSGEINISFNDPVLYSIKMTWSIHIQNLKVHNMFHEVEKVETNSVVEEDTDSYQEDYEDDYYYYDDDDDDVTQEDKMNYSDSDTKESSTDDGVEENHEGNVSLKCEWKVRSCSMKGNVISCTDQINTDGLLKVKILMSTDDTRNTNTLWKKTSFERNIRQKTKFIPFQQWDDLFYRTCDVNNHSELINTFGAIRDFIKQDNKTSDDTPSTAFSPLCITYIKLSLQPKEVIKVWLTSTIERNLISPTIQLIELDPMVRICVQHNNDPAKTFAGRLTKSVANKDKYEDEEEYHQLWQPLLVAEAATDTTDDNDIMILHDVKIEWPQLDFKYDSTGTKYYCVPDNEKKNIVINFEKEFIETSLPFFYVSIGCLLCIRYKETDEGNTIQYIMLLFTL